MWFMNRPNHGTIRPQDEAGIRELIPALLLVSSTSDNPQNCRNNYNV